MASNVTYVSQCPDMYKCSKMEQGTLFLPLFNESDWPLALRAVLYLLTMLWFFMGVAIGADLFMCAIEVITSKTKTIRVANEEEAKGYEEVDIRVWNDTVANLTLMALGSSAPEILLSVIEIVSKGFKAGELGPGTIVGSAAFNLLCITACCVMAVDKPKRINSFNVFLITAFFSVFAYIWLFMVISIISKNKVDIWEAVITLLWFPILVILAYIADKNLCGNFSLLKKNKERIELNNMDLLDEKVLKKHRPDLIEYMKEITSNPALTEDEAAKLIAIKMEQSKKKNYGYYRVGALRSIGGGRKVVPTIPDKLKPLVSDGPGAKLLVDADPLTPRVEFVATAVSVLESAKVAQLTLVRSRNLSEKITIRYETIDGTAEAGSDYIAKKGTLTFEPQETTKQLEVVIIDDYEWEPDETFFIKLHSDVEESKNVEIGPHSIAEVTIINDDEPGTIGFTKPSHIVKESCGKAEVEVERVNGADGKVELVWKTKDQSALHGKDYIGGEGTLIFEHGETVKTIDIEIIDDHQFEKDETFMIEFTDLKTQGAKFGRLKKTVVTVVSDDEYRRMFDRVVHMAHLNMDKFELGSATWGQQFTEAMSVNGGDVENATALDYGMHFATFFWKVLFAFVPPCSWYGGWLSFVIILAMIGIMTALIGDIATIFGCLISLKPEVTAITFVALGTSLPDLFASKNAACNEEYADAAIGNVTGSNGVNVFLGLGIPWVIATIYHKIKGSTFDVSAGSLATSVVTYAVCATICIFLLIARRFIPAFGGGELGGPKAIRFATGGFMIFLWFVYLLVSSLVAYGHLSPI